MRTMIPFIVDEGAVADVAVLLDPLICSEPLLVRFNEIIGVFRHGINGVHIAQFADNRVDVLRELRKIGPDHEG